MVQTTSRGKARPGTGEEALAELRRLQDELLEANPDMTEDDWDALARQWAADVEAGLAERVRTSRMREGAANR